MSTVLSRLYRGFWGPAPRSLASESASDDGEAPPTHMPEVCSVPRVPEADRPVPVAASHERARLIRINEKRWVNGTTIRYHLLRGAKFAGTEAEMEVVRQGWATWRDVGIGLSFEEVDTAEASDVRIGFVKGKGACASRFTCIRVPWGRPPQARL